MRRAAIVAAVFTLSLAGPGAARPGDVDDYLTKEGKLKHALEFREGQSGFAGVTGTVWNIEPSGAWTVATFLNEKTQKTLRKGQLSDKRLAALAHHLASLDVLKLPKEMGGYGGANPRLFSLRCGDKTTAVVTNPGQDMREMVPPKGADAAAWSRFVAAALVIEHWTRDGEPGGAPDK